MRTRSDLTQDAPMKPILRLFSTAHALMALLFACAALLLIAIAARIGWVAVSAGLDRAAAQGIIEAVGLLAAAVVALQIAQTITEEEVIRDSNISAPTRVRRFLSRFLGSRCGRTRNRRTCCDVQSQARGHRSVAVCGEPLTLRRTAPCWLGCICSPQSLRGRA